MDKNMEVAEEQVHISVRNLVEFILRSGDIDNRVAGADKDAMLLGGKMHGRSREEWGQITMQKFHLRLRFRVMDSRW